MEELNFKKKTVLAVGAHPDDNDFGAGGTVAKAVKDGARVIYIVATSGQRGSSDKKMTPDQLAKIREKEQQEAAKALGVKKVHFLGYCDGELNPDLVLKEQVVRYIREYKPEIVITMDPSHFFYRDLGFVNHSDHRAIGEATLDAAYPLARDLLSFPEHQKLGLAPHKVKYLLLTSIMSDEANYFVDISDVFEKKVKALSRHKTQIGKISDVRKWMKFRASENGKKCGFELAEAFIRLRLRD